jgi:hypothetical protein
LVITGGSDEEEDEEGEEKKTSRADDTGADDVLQLGRLIGNIANNAIITNCLLLLKYHRLNPYAPRPTPTSRRPSTTLKTLTLGTSAERK